VILSVSRLFRRGYRISEQGLAHQADYLRVLSWQGLGLRLLCYIFPLPSAGCTRRFGQKIMRNLHLSALGCLFLCFCGGVLVSIFITIGAIGYGLETGFTFKSIVPPVLLGFCFGFAVWSFRLFDRVLGREQHMIIAALRLYYTLAGTWFILFSFSTHSKSDESSLVSLITSGERAFLIGIFGTLVLVTFGTKHDQTNQSA